MGSLRLLHAPALRPLLGDLPEFIDDKLGFLLSRAASQGDVVPLRLGGPTLLLRHPEDIRHVLEVNPFNYEKTPRLTSRRGRWLSGHGLLTSGMRESRSRRRALQPVYASGTVAAFATTISAATDRHLHGWPTDGTVDLAAETMALAQRVMGLLLCGVDVQSPQGRALGRAVSERRRFLHDVFDSLLPLAEFLPTPDRLAYARAMRRLHRSLQLAINERRACPEAFPDLLALLMQARTAEGTPLTPRELRDEALTFALPGYETIGECLAWSLHLLSLHPDVTAAVRRGERPPERGRRPAHQPGGSAPSGSPPAGDRRKPAPLSAHLDLHPHGPGEGSPAQRCRGKGGNEALSLPLGVTSQPALVSRSGSLQP